MVERWPFKPMAVGSIPTEGVIFLFLFGEDVACEVASGEGVHGRVV